MKINTTVVLKTLKGEALQNPDKTEITLGEALGLIMASHEMGGKMKCFILAQKFSTEKEVEVDSADLKLVKEACESTKVFISLVSGQILLILEELTESKK